VRRSHHQCTLCRVANSVDAIIFGSSPSQKIPFGHHHEHHNSTLYPNLATESCRPSHDIVLLLSFIGNAGSSLLNNCCSGLGPHQKRNPQPCWHCPSSAYKAATHSTGSTLKPHMGASFAMNHIVQSLLVTRVGTYAI